MHDLAGALHVSLSTFYVLVFLLLILVALGLGLALKAVLRRFARRSSGWKEFFFSLFGALPIPLLLVAALYTGLQVLTLPRRYNQLFSELLATLLVLSLYLFPAKVVVLFLERLGKHRPESSPLTHFGVTMTRAGFALLALYTLLETLELPRRYERLGSKLAAALGIVLVFYTISKIVILYLRRIEQRDPALKQVAEPAIYISRAVFALLAAIVVLENLGVHLTALWTTLGVGSVAVALALQETLSNLFAGLYLLADRPISPGNYVKLDSGQEGYVVQVGWRSTRILTLANNLVVVPNSTMGKAVITNYSLPARRMGIGIPVSVAYGTDPIRLEKILLEVVQEAGQDKVAGLLLDPPPGVQLNPGFGDSSLNFTLSVQVGEFVGQYALQSELRKRIYARLQREKIEIPFPTRTLIFDPAIVSALQRPEEQAPAQPNPEEQASQPPGPESQRG